MANTLTWDIKPIQLPKVNANLLSVVSLILLLTMAFMMGHPALASHCDQIVLELGLASALVGAATVALELSKAALAGAVWTLNPAVMAGLAAAVAASAAALAIAVAAVAYLTAKLYECENEHGGSANTSGGCDSGSCGGTG